MRFSTTHLAALSAGVLCVGLLASAASARQAPKNDLPEFLKSVQVKSATPSTPVGGRANVVFTVTVADTYHVYGSRPGDPNAIPTTLMVRPIAPGVKAGTPVFSAPITRDKVRIHEGTFTITVPVTIAANVKPGAIPVTAVLRSQGCTDSACLPPAAVTLTTTLNVTGRVPNRSVGDVGGRKKTVVPPGPGTKEAL
jgi:hypothetical protein